MPEVYTPYFSTTLTSAISSTARPAAIAVASTNSLLGVAGATFSCLIFDVGWDGQPGTAAANHVEALEITSGGGTLNWTGTTESGWSATTHANGSVVVATVLTPRALTQQLSDHTTVVVTPDPHSIYLRKDAFTSKGGIITGTGAGTFLVESVGVDGQLLMADSTQSSGIRWSTVGAASVLQHMGDLIVGALLGVAARLGIGSIGQALVVAQNSPTVANPSLGPTCIATGSGGSLVNGQQYDFAFAWRTPNASPDGGITQISPITTFAATSTGVVQVQCGAAPAPNLTLVVYAATTGGSLQVQGTINNASTSTSNNVNVNSIVSGDPPSSSNTTGGLSAAWSSVGSVSSVGLSAPTEFSVSGSPVTGSGTLALSKANQSPHTVFAGPASGSSSAQPTFRLLAASDLPVISNHEQFAPNSGNTITLAKTPFVVSVVAKNGVVLQELESSAASASLSSSASMHAGAAGSLDASTSASASMQAVATSSNTGTVYSINGTTLTFSTSFQPGDHVVVAYMG